MCTPDSEHAQASQAKASRPSDFGAGRRGWFERSRRAEEYVIWEATSASDVPQPRLALPELAGRAQVEGRPFLSPLSLGQQRKWAGVWGQSPRCLGKQKTHGENLHTGGSTRGGDVLSAVRRPSQWVLLFAAIEYQMRIFASMNGSMASRLSVPAALDRKSLSCYFDPFTISQSRTYFSLIPVN